MTDINIWNFCRTSFLLIKSINASFILFCIRNLLTHTSKFFHPQILLHLYFLVVFCESKWSLPQAFLQVVQSHYGESCVKIKVFYNLDRNKIFNELSKFCVKWELKITRINHTDFGSNSAQITDLTMMRFLFLTQLTIIKTSSTKKFGSVKYNDKTN